MRRSRKGKSDKLLNGATQEKTATSELLSSNNARDSWMRFNSSRQIKRTVQNQHCVTDLHLLCLLCAPKRIDTQKKQTKIATYRPLDHCTP